MRTAGRSRLRVGLVCYGLDRPLSGTTRVVEQLGAALAEDATSACDVVYLTPYQQGAFRSAPYRSWHLPGCRLLPGLMLLGGPEISLAARRLRLDVVHDPVGVSPFTLGRWAGSFKRLVHVHDAIAFRYPEGYPLLNNLLHRSFVPMTLRNVDAVLTGSEHAAADVECFLGWPRARTFVVPHGIAPHFRPVPRERAKGVAARYKLDGPFVLSVGSLQARKNLDRLVAAFGSIRASFPGYRLGLVGPSQWPYSKLAAAMARERLEESVVLVGHVPDEDLAALYSAADLFVFPSLYEGFGFPPLEAMACGTAVVCSSASSLPEVVGSAALLVDPESTDEIADGMRRVLADESLRRHLAGAGLIQASRYTWARAAAATTEVYRAALGA